MEDYTRSLAEREIIIRLINVLKNESNNDVIFKTENNVQCFIHPKNHSKVLISNDYESQTDSESLKALEIDSKGNIKKMSYDTLLTYILDIWKVLDKNREKTLYEVKNSFNNLCESFEWEQSNLELIEVETKKILGKCLTPIEKQECLRISESLPFKGHPLHPCTKTKFGISKADIIKYAPEFRNCVNIPLVALKKDSIKQQGNLSLWENYLNKKHNIKVNDDEIIFPVHPWHLENVIYKYFDKDLKKGQLKELSSISSYPTLSFRTMMVEDYKNNLGIYIKLPIAVQATSVFRLLSKRDIYNGITISNFIQKEYTNLKSITTQKASIISDIFGAHSIKSENILHESPPLLSFVLRESPLALCSESEKILTASSLTHRTPLRKNPLLKLFHKQSNLSNIEFIEKIFEILLFFPIELFLKYGIAIDPHGQNCLLKFSDNGHPLSLVYRDLGSVQMTHNSFTKTMESSLIDLNKTIISYQECMEEFIHSLYNNLIRDFINCFSEYTLTNKNTLWSLVKEVSLNIIKNIDCDEQEKNKFIKVILNQKIPIKSLLRMRVENRVIFNLIDNPFYNK
ncbi:IucA/IucC family protein [Riemerella columbina]|uniref:IucA/IucC family protein n=1 Tax=Riemerella columbina TaxID=103810 RepID=UPI0003678F9F|nr:IucA/IucC family protein [Riemerella columbina]